VFNAEWSTSLCVVKLIDGIFVVASQKTNSISETFCVLVEVFIVFVEVPLNIINFQ